jgi:preprotein translocase subunit YajC
MARRWRIYGKKRKIHYGRITLLLLIVVVVIFLISIPFRKEKYLDAIDKAVQSTTSEISGTINSVSDVDISVYSNNGIRYTNRHEDIKRLNSFSGANPDEAERAAQVKKLFESIYKLKETVAVEDLSLKKDGYYWIDAEFRGKDEYDFDLFYDIENKTVYIKTEYYNEYSTKNNKQKLQGYEASEEFVNTIEKLTNTNEQPTGQQDEAQE